MSQLIANPATAFNTPSFSGAIYANLPLLGADGVTSAPISMLWSLGQPLTSYNPQITGSVAALVPAPTSLLTAGTLGTVGAAGLQQMGQWASTLANAAGQTGALAVKLPLLNQSISSLSGITAILNAIGSAVIPELRNVVGEHGELRPAPSIRALTSFNGSHSGFTLTADPTQTYAGLIPAANATAAESLGLTAGIDQVVFNLALTAAYTGAQAVALSSGPGTDNVSFNTNVNYSSTLKLGITFGVQLTSNLDATDATFVRLNQLDASVNLSATNLSFATSVGVLGAQVSNGTITLTAQAGAQLPGSGSAGAQPQTISQILGTSVSSLLTIVPEASSLTATLPVTASLSGLTSASATIGITGDPLSGNAPAVTLNGYNAPDFSSFASLQPSDLLSALSSIANSLNGIGNSSLMSTNIPLTSLTLGKAADYGAEFIKDVLGPLTDTHNSPDFSNLQQLVTDLTAAAGISGVTTSYSNHQLSINFALQETFATTPASFNYDLTAPSGSILSDLGNVVSTSGSLSVSGTGSVQVGFNFNLTPTSVTVQGALPLPSNGVLAPGNDANFSLSLSADGSSPTVVPVTVSAAAAQGNTTTAQLIAEINTALQQALGAAGLDANLVTASTASISGGQALVLTLSAGAFSALTVISAPLDPSVYELGLEPSQTPTATITAASSLPTNGRLTADATFTVTADGGTATPVTITAASTASNSNQSQLLTQVQTAMAALNTTLTNAYRTPIVVALNSSGALTFTISGYGSTLQIAAATSAQIGLGLLPLQSIEAGAPSVSVTASAAAVPSSFVLTADQTFSITVDGRQTFQVTVKASSTTTNKTSQDLADDVNAALSAVNADLKSAGLAQVLASVSDTGRLVFTTSGSSASILLRGQAGNQLGIGSNDGSTSPTISIIGSQNFGDQISLTKLQLGGSLSLSGSVSASASFGIVDINLGPATISLNPTISLGLNQTVLLNNLLSNPSSLLSYFGGGPTLSGAASLTLPISVTGPLATTLGLDSSASIGLSATNMFQLNSWTADTTHLEQLLNLQSFSFSNLQTALTQLASFIAGFAANGLLGEKIPLVDVTLGNLLGITQDFNSIVSDLQNGAQFTLDQLQSTLNAAISQAFGFSSTGNFVTLSMNGGIMKIALAFQPTLPTASIPLNFDLNALHISGGTSLAGVTDFTGSNLTITPSASFNITLDVDLTTPTNPQVLLDQATALHLGLLISGLGASAQLAIGPIGIFVAGGTLALSSSSDTTKPATFNITLKQSEPLQNLANGAYGWFGTNSPFSAAFDGAVTVSLPLAAPTAGNSIGTLGLKIPNLGNFVSDLLVNTGNISNDITFSVPDLSNLFNSIDLLGNDTGIIGALDTFLGVLQTVLNQKLFSLSIPLVGNGLQSAASFITDLKSKIDALNSGAGMAALQQALFNVLGPSGANLLKPGSGEATATLKDVVIEFEQTGTSTFTTFNGSNAPSADKIQDVQFLLNLGGDYKPSVPINFNLGLPGLGLSVQNGTIGLDMLWSLALDFGVDRSSGLYFKTPGAGTDLQLEMKATLAAGSQLTAQLGFLAVTATQPGATDSVTGKPALPTMLDLTFAAGFTGGLQTLTLSSLGGGSLPGVTATFGGSASVDLDLSLGFDISNGAVDTAYPNFVAQLLIGGGGNGQTPWTFSGNNLAATTAPCVAINDIQLDFGSFLNNYIGAILGPVVSVLKPLEPIIDFLNTEVPIINEPLLQAVVDLFGGDAQNVGEFFSFLSGIIHFASDFSGGTGGSPLRLSLGSFDFGTLDLRQLPGTGGNSLPDTSSSGGFNQLVGDLQNMAGALDFQSQSQIDSSAAQANPTFGADWGATGETNITFPILDNPMSVLGLMFGQQVTLVHITAPKLVASANFSVDIPVYPAVTADLTANFGIFVKFAAGYDTYGLVEAGKDIKAGNVSAVPGDLADGLFIDDTKGADGLPATAIGITGGIGIGASVGLGGLISVGVGGGIQLSIGVSLKDSAPANFGTPEFHKANDNDNKTRISEFVAWVGDYGNPLCAFNLDGAVSFDLYLQEQLLFATFTQTLVSITLFDFTAGANCFDQFEPLGSQDANGVVTLFTGPLWQSRDVWQDQNAFSADYGKVVVGGPQPNGEYGLVKGPTSEGGDTFTVTERGPGDIIVSAGDGATEEFKNVTGIKSTLGVGKNELNIESALTETDGTTSVNETIIGGTGNDTIIAGGGNDLIEGGGGADQIQAGQGSSTIYGGTPSALGVGPGDTITGGSHGHNLIYGSTGSDVIIAPGAGNTVYGGPNTGNTQGGPTLLVGSGGGNILVGGSGNDVIEGGGGSTIVGNGGNNLIVGGSGVNLIYGGSANSVLAGLAPQGYATALSLFGTPPATPAGQNVIFAGAASLTLLQTYGNVNAANNLNLPINNLPKNAPAPGDGNDTVYAAAHGDQIFGGTARNELHGGAGPDTIVGGPVADTITGGGGNELIIGRGTDTIYGGTGNDTIYGGPGSSTIIGDTQSGGAGGNDYIQGGDGGNTIYGGVGNATILGGNGADTIIGGSGNDSIRGQGSNDTIQGGSGNDSIYGDAGLDTIYGGTGKDLISGNSGNDTVLGGTNNDSIYGGQGANTLYGGQGNDYISAVGGNNDSVFGGSGNTTIWGGGNYDTIAGGVGNDFIVAGTGPDQITGGAGNDSIVGGAGFDVILGGTGNDSIQGGTGGDLIHGGKGHTTIHGGSGPETIYAGDLSSNVTGGSGVDLLVGGTSADTITGGSGNATIIAGSGTGNVLSGGSGNDLIFGTASIGIGGHGDTITGGSGNVTIWGSAGDDSIIGGTGNDIIHAGLGNQTIYAGTGTTEIYGGPGTANLSANQTGSGTTVTTPDTIYGGTGTATIIGNAGDDLLYGGAGKDSIFGGSGSDVIYGGAGTGKTIQGGGGSDTIWASSGGGDSIFGGTGNVEIFAEGGNNTVLGGSGNDTIEGEGSGNVLSGGSGNDLIVGGQGGDTINAGDPSSTNPGTGQDTIYGDLVSSDKITGNNGNDLIYAGVGDTAASITKGGGPGTQVFLPGVAAAASYAATPVPEQNPTLNTAATLPTNVATSGIWATLAGGIGSSIGTPTINNGGPGIVADSGTRYVAWIDTRGGIPAVYVATESNGTWSQLGGSAQGFGISGFLEAASEPAIALLASGRPVVAWTARTRTGTDIQVAAWDPTANSGAGAWVALGNSLSAGGISATGKATNAEVLVIGGKATVLWLDTTGGTSNIYAEQFNGSAWVTLGAGANTGNGISGSTLAVTQFAAATDGTNLAVAWTQAFASGPTQVYLKQYSGGTWAALGTSASGKGLSNAQYAASSPTVAYAGGKLFAAWQQYINSPTQSLTPSTFPASQTVFEQAPVIYAAEYNAGTWQPAGTGAETGFGVSNNADISLAPQLASDGVHLILAWSDESLVAAGTSTHLFVATWNGSAFVPAQPGQASGLGIAQSTSGLDNLSLTLDPNGNPFAAWADFGDSGATLRVIGTPTTPSAVTVVSSEAALQTALSSAVSGSVIYLAAGTYAGSLTLGTNDNNVTLVGQPGLGAVIQGSVVINGSNVTLQGLTIAGNITGFGSGFALRSSMQSSGTLTLQGANQIIIDTRIIAQGVVLQGATNLELRGNTISAAGAGIEIGAGNSGKIDYNTISGSTVGIDIANAFSGLIINNVIQYSPIGVNYLAAAALAGNRIVNNVTGVVATVADPTTAFGFVAGSGVNTISNNQTGVNLTGLMQDQIVSNNTIGVTGSGTIGGTSLLLMNDINHNATGISGFTGTIQFSRIDNNGVGIVANANQIIQYNLIYNNQTIGLHITGVANVRVFQDTFYSLTGDNIRIDGGASNAEIQNSILWARGGYDIYVANDSQTGFFSDYNSLVKTDSGILVYWTRDFNDILDWQDDVALYDLHSVGTTVVHPTDGRPNFVDAINDNFQLLPQVGGQTVANPGLEQGSALVAFTTAPSSKNLLTNPGFESGLTGWTASTGGAVAGPASVSGYPPAFNGGDYFAAGQVQSGFVTQTVDLLGSGLTAAQIDGGGLNLIFGGRVRSGISFPPDTGQIQVTLLNASKVQIGTTVIVAAPNVADRWALVGGTTALLSGTRYVIFQFTATRQTGNSYDESFLDDSFLGTVGAGSAAPDGPYPTAAVSDTTAGVGRIMLTSPVLYVNWIENAPHLITWANFGNAGVSTQSVRIDLYQDVPVSSGGPPEPKFLLTITASTANTGSYTWIPTPGQIPFGTHGLRIQVSLVSSRGVFDRSTEAFTIPENSTNYYVNDSSTANDQYTTAVGSNRNDGVKPSEPLPNIDNVLRNYSLGSGSTIYVDPGTYPMIAPFEISGQVNYGLGIDQGFVVQGPTVAPATLTPAIPGNLVNLIQLENANLVTINNLTLVNAGRGIYVQSSTGFSATGDTVTGMAYEGVRIDTNSSVTLLKNLTVSNSGSVGIYDDAPTGSIIGANITGSGALLQTYQYSNQTLSSGLYTDQAVGTINGSFTNNHGWGMYLTNPGSVVVNSSTIFGNGYGLYISNPNGPQALIGDPILTDGRGNTIHDNGNYGIFAYGSVTVAGNVVYNEAGSEYGIEVSNAASALDNVVWASGTGIIADGATQVTSNRVYDITGVGIFDIRDTGNGGTIAITDNVIYSTGTGIVDTRYYSNQAVLIGNNLIYANTAAAIEIFGNSNVNVINNTIDQPTGDGVDISVGNTNTKLRNNIFVMGSGVAINVAADSQNGFSSDYNLFYLPNGATGSVGVWQAVARVTLGAWQAAAGVDINSFTANPLFVNPTGAAGVLGFISAAQPGYDNDFHLQSKYADFRGGSLSPVIVNGKAAFPAVVGGTDAQQSPAIDRGDASYSYALEPAPNGGYINLGNYGDTAQASKSPSAYVLVLTPAAGATIQTSSTVTIKWRSFGFAGNVSIAYSADGGATFTSIVASVANNGSYAWAVPSGLTAGSNYLIKVTSVSTGTVFGVSPVFTVSGRINDYYISPTGNDLTNNGLSAATPKASIQGLLSAYALGAGDIIHAASGTYAVTTNISLTGLNSGTATSPFIIEGPTSGPPAVLNRGNLTSGQDVFDLTGVNYVTIQDLTITGAFNGIEIGGPSTGVQILNDIITANSDTGILLDQNTGSLVAGVNGLVISNDIISGNGLDTPYGNYYGGNQSGVYVQLGNGGILFQNDQVFLNNKVGIDFVGGYGSTGTSTIQGGAYYSQRGVYGGTGYGIYDSTGNLIENALVYGNNGDGIYQSNNGGYTTTHSGTITGNTVFSNRDAGIEAHAAIVTGNLIYNQGNTSRNALELDSGSTGTGNTIFGSANGIFLDGAAYATKNVVYDVTGSGIDYGNSAPAPIVGNTVYGAGTGISGAEYYTGPVISITGNLIYQTTIAAIALYRGLYQNIVNNTIDSPIGTGITIYGGASSTTIENNIIAVGSGPAISIDPSSESGLLSDYNLFDLTGTTAVIGQWESVLYPSLATWYYEIGLDQHSQTGDPGFVSPAGVDGILGFGTVTAAAKIIDSGGAGFATTGTWSLTTNSPDYAYQIFGSGPTATAAFNITSGQTYEIAAMSNGTVLAIEGQIVGIGSTTTLAAYHVVNGVTASTELLPTLGYNGTSLISPAGSGATATWTFTGLTPGQVYELGASWPLTFIAGSNTDAHFGVVDEHGTPVIAANFYQYYTTPSGITQGGTTFSLVGYFTATGTSAVVTLTGDPNGAMIADAVLLMPVGQNGGADDNFHVKPGSKAIDAGDPTTAWLAEPSPNGGRVNLGYDGNTPQAQTSGSPTLIQVLSPGGLAKYQAGETIPINFQADGLTTLEPVLLLHAGGSAIATALNGNWSGDPFRLNGQSFTDNVAPATIGTVGNAPASLFLTGAQAASAGAGQTLSFQIPVADGTYTLQLYFAEPTVSNVGYRVFNIIANGVTLQANFDPYATAAAQFSGNGSHAVALTLSVTVSGGIGLRLDFSFASGYYAPMVNGIELLRSNPSANASPVANVSVSTDNGVTWTQIGTNVPINSFGEGQVLWTVNTTSTGNMALIQGDLRHRHRHLAAVPAGQQWQRLLHQRQLPGRRPVHHRGR